MKVAMVTDTQRVEIKEVEKPVVGSKDILIKVKAAGICGSDLHLFKGTHAFRKPPAVLGHEIAGEVIEVGSEVSGFKTGDRVTVEPHIGCGKCEFCSEGFVNLCLNKRVPGTPDWCGTFAEYFVASEEITYKLAEGVSYELGTLAEPLAVALHGIRRSSLTSKDSMVILGSGTIGLLSLVLAKHFGFKRVVCTDTLSFNLDLAKKLGADLVLNPLETDVVDATKKFTDNRGADVTIVAAGAPNILDQASSITRRRGEMVLLAMITEKIPVYTYSMVFNEQTLFGAMTYQSKDFAEAINFINQGLDLSQLITHRFPMEDSQKGLEILDQRTEDAVKIIVRP